MIINNTLKKYEHLLVFFFTYTNYHINITEGKKCLFSNLKLYKNLTKNLYYMYIILLKIHYDK